MYASCVWSTSLHCDVFVPFPNGNIWWDFLGMKKKPKPGTIFRQNKKGTHDSGDGQKTFTSVVCVLVSFQGYYPSSQYDKQLSYHRHWTMAAVWGLPPHAASPTIFLSISQLDSKDPGQLWLMGLRCYQVNSSKIMFSSLFSFIPVFIKCKNV